MTAQSCLAQGCPDLLPLRSVPCKWAPLLVIREQKGFPARACCGLQAATPALAVLLDTLGGGRGGGGGGGGWEGRQRLS